MTDGNPQLVPLLLEAREHVKRVFGSDAPVVLAVVENPEAVDSTELFVLHPDAVAGDGGERGSSSSWTRKGGSMSSLGREDGSTSRSNTYDGRIPAGVSLPGDRLPSAGPARVQATRVRCLIAAMPPGSWRDRAGTRRHQRDSNFFRDIGRLAVK
jgi:hypothetical protein